MNEVARIGRNARKGIIIGLLVLAAPSVFASAPAQAATINSTPMRVIGPYASGQSGTWTAADDRSVGPALTGQDGWNAGTCASSAGFYDQEVSHAAAHTGTQALRLSNWYTSPCVDSIVSPTFAAVGESGSKTAANAPAVSNTAVQDFWFRTASTQAEAGNSFTTQFGALASYRLNYLAFVEQTPGDANSGCADTAAGCFNLAAIDIQPSPNAPSYVHFQHYHSPDLVRGAWYHVTVAATFVDGSITPNDQIVIKVLDSNGATVWSQTTGSWEYGYASGLFNGHPHAPGTFAAPVQGPFAAANVTFDISASTGPGTPNSYASTEQHGVYIDDMSVVPGSGAGFVTSFDTNRYVAPSGANTGDCTTQASPCQTIAYAIAQSTAYNVIHIASGTYTLPAASPLTITQEGLQLIGEGATKPVVTIQAGPINQTLVVVNGVKNVHIENLSFGMDQSFIAEGIIANGFVDGLSIINNQFTGTRSSASANSKYSWRNAISINDDNGNSRGLGIAPGSNVTITGNTISGTADTLNGVFLRIGVDMDNGVGTISGNTIAAGVHDIRVRFATTNTSSSATTTLIDGNMLNGRGLEYDSANAGVGAITISNNHINAIAGITGNTPYAADWSLVRLIDNQQNIPTTLSGNTFAGHNGSYRGVLIENYPGINLTGNTFTPANGAANFVSLVISNKEINTGAAIAPYAMSIAATGNTFNGSGTAGAGTAVEFLNDNDAGNTAAFGMLLFGGTGTNEANVFDGNLRWYFHLDDFNCDTVSTPCTFLDYNGAIGNAAATNTQVRPFRGNVSAANNTFAGAAPSAATATSLQAHTYDKNANSVLGAVDYGVSGTTPIVYVGASFAGSAYGDAKSFVSGAPACGNQTVYFGINAFATIPDGITHVQTGGIVCIAKGAYADNVTISKLVQLVGDGNGTSDTVLSQGITVNASGTDSAHPLVIENLRVTDPASGHNGILVMQQSYLAFRSLALVGNGYSGINLSRDTHDVTITDSLISGNQTGLRTSSTTNAANVAISNSTFSNNASVGLILFGGSNGSGSATNWTISNSQFLSNDATDATSFGGGIWIDSFGPTTTVDGFTVTGSTFADNGSAAAIQYKRGGILVSATGGGVLKNVSICTNTFTENPGTPGTQKNGIVVSDGTNNTGYQPITVCADNVFNGTDHSISGKSQYETLGSQPVVNITGGTIANTEYINGFVSRIHAGTQNGSFPTITAAMNDANTVNGDEIHAPAGVYRENVVITHDGITLSGDGASTIINGTGLAGNGIDASTRQNVTITALAVQNFNINSSEGACIYTSGGSNGLTITHTVLSECRTGRGGIYVNAIGDVSNVTLSNNDVSNSDGRGIVVWNGAKSHLAINDNTIHDIAGSGGIGLQDGTASDVTISGNTLSNTGDSGIFALGMSSGTISNNQVGIAGRYGIQLLNPSGANAAAITIQGNTVNLTALPAANDDIAGISVARRYVSAGGADNPSGVTIVGNTVHGWQSNSARPGYDGFGVAVEGTAISVSANTLDNNDIGVQLQAGNAGYPGDSNQSLVNDFFSRGDAQSTCADLGANTFTANGIDSRSVTNPSGQSLAVVAHNITRGTSFCTIQGAINDAATVAGDTITVDAGTFGENVIVSKAITLRGPYTGTAGDDAGRGTGEAVISPASGTALTLKSSNATIDGFELGHVTASRVVYKDNTAGTLTGVQFINNRVVDFTSTSPSGAAIYMADTGTATDGMEISGNLFQDLGNGPTNGNYAMGIKVMRVANLTIAHNVFRRVQSNAMQLTSVAVAQVDDNIVDGGSANYTNVGIQVTFGSDVKINSNAFTNTLQAFLFNANSGPGVAFTCNTVTSSAIGVRGALFGTSGATISPAVFDNYLAATTSLRNDDLPGNAVFGSNYYGGGAASTSGNVLAADPLTATPIGNAACGDNTPTAVVAYTGTPQSTLINTAFSQALSARVVDALGGAVAGQSIAFNVPASGPSVNLASSSGTSNYNGVVATAANANALAGSYNVSAASGALGAASFALTNLKGIGTVVFDNLNLTYTGSAQTLTAHMTPADTNVTCVVNPATVTNAGSYPVTATCSGDNYAASGSATVTVDKKVGTITFDSGMPYTGAPQNVTAHITEEPGAACSATPATVGPDAGSYAVNVASCDGTNYTASGNGVVVISKAASTVTITPTDLQQNFGSTHAVHATASPITTGSVSVSYDGSPNVPTATGSYSIVATLNDPNYTGQASAILVVSDASQVTLTTSGPAQALIGASAPYTDLVDYTGTIGNTGSTTSQTVHYEITVVRIDDGNGTGGQPIAIDANDVRACIYDPSGYAAQDPNDHHGCPQDYDSLFLSQAPGAFNGRPATTFRYPNLAQYDQALPTIDPAIPLPPSKFQFKHGDYQVHVSVVGANGTVYATAQAQTTVPDAHITYNGATSGQAEDALLSQATLTNVGGRVDGNVIVRVTLSDAANAALTPADATLYYQYGSGYVALPWTQAGNNLVTYYGPGTGFPLEDGHNATTSAQGIFHREGGFNVLYEVVDVATQQVIYASTTQSIAIGASLVNFSLSDLQQVYNGTPRAISVAPSNVPHAVIYETQTGSSCPAAPLGNDITPPTNAGSYCVYVTATAPYSGTAQGVLVIAKAMASVSIDGAVSGVVNRTFNGNPQVVTATATPTVAAIDLTYNGNASAPSAAGSYSLLATINDPNYVGSTTGTLVVSTQGGTTITLDDDDGTNDGIIHRSFSGSAVAPVSATTTPTGVTYAVTYVGDGSTQYPLTSTPPTAVGQYHVVATTTDPNYASVSASGTLVVDAIDATLTTGGDNTGVVVLPASAVQRYSVSTATTHLNGASPSENVVAHLVISHASGASASDLDVDYLAATQQAPSCVPATGGGYWCPLALIANGDGTLSATFGPPTGFPLTDNATSTFRSRFHRGGQFVTALTIDGVGTGTTYASAAQAVDVAELAMQIIWPASAGTGVAVDTSVNLVNGGSAAIASTVAAPNNENVIGQFQVTLAGSTLTPADLTVSYLAPDAAYHVIALTACASDANSLCASFGPAAGFPVAPGYNGTSLFRTVFQRDGAFTVSTTAQGVSSGALFAQASQSIAVMVSSSTIAIDAASLAQTYNGGTHPVIVTTTPAGLSYTVTYAGNATPPTDAGSYAVVATITQAGYSGTASGTLVVAKAIGSVDFGATNFTFDGVAHSISATLVQDPAAVCTVTTTGEYPRTNAGSSSVNAQCDGTNYSAQASTTLVVAPKSLTLALSDLGPYVYDAQAHAATVTVSGDIAGFPASADLTYNGNAAAPVNAGSYTVTAALDAGSSQNYVASPVSGLLTIDKAAATVTLSNLQQIYDGTPKSVVVTTGPANLPVALTYDGNAAAPSAIGSYTVVATVTDPNYTGTASAMLQITAADAPDLAVTITDQRDYVQFGKLLTYTIVVNNAGNTAISGATVTDNLPPELDVANATWQCFASGTATCTALGTGNIADTVSIPVNGGVTYVLTATVLNDQAAATDVITNTVTVSASGDSNPVNDSAIDSTQAVIFRDSFEIGGDGAQWPTGTLDISALGGLSGSGVMPIAIAPAQLVAYRITPIAQASNGAFRVEAIRSADGVWLRLVARNGASERVSAWSALDSTSAMLAIGNNADGSSSLILVGAAHDLQVRLDAAGPFAMESRTTF